MNRDRAVDLTEHLLRNLHAGQFEWPLNIITEVYVFGSFSRGALTPNDLDINLEYERTEQWQRYRIGLLGSGRDPYVPIRKAISTGRRGYQFLFEYRQHADFEMTLLWRRGDSLETALEGLHAIQSDPSAGRAPRDSMLPQFEGIDEWIPRSYREAMFSAAESGAIAVERIVLPDVRVASGLAEEHIGGRWSPTSPLYRAALAVAAYWEKQGVDAGKCRMHTREGWDRETQYFVSFDWRYFGSVARRLSRDGAIEWLEVVHPTRAHPLDCLRITPLNKRNLSEATWN